MVRVGVPACPLLWGPRPGLALTAPEWGVGEPGLFPCRAAHRPWCPLIGRLGPLLLGCRLFLVLSMSGSEMLVTPPLPCQGLDAAG